jgi:hypothetical protein
MSRNYWKYFLDTVRYPQIQRPGPLALLAEAEGGELDRLYQSGLGLRDQFFPARAENESVAIHGRARGIPRHFLENDEQYRRRVIKAWAWQRLAGRHWGLYQIFAEYGFPIISLSNLSGERWAEFDIEVEIPSGQGFTDEVHDLILWLVFEYKRASAMLRGLRLVKRTRGRLVIACGILSGEYLTLYPKPPEDLISEGEIKIMAAPLEHEHWSLRPVSTRTFQLFGRRRRLFPRVKEPA